MSGQDALHTLKAVDGIHQSLASDQPVSLMGANLRAHELANRQSHAHADHVLDQSCRCIEFDHRLIVREPVN